MEELHIIAKIVRGDDMSLVVGITGGIACGKSNVCNNIRDLGYKVLDCDKISYELSLKGNSLYKKIIEAFGNDYLLDSGEIDRRKLGKLIFNDIEKRKLLNSISHPLIKEELIKQIKKLDDDIIFIEVPLLYESGFDDLCDYVICCYLDEKLQISRLMERDLIDRTYAINKINSQMSLLKKKLFADYIINTKGSFNDTKKQVEKIIQEIKGV